MSARKLPSVLGVLGVMALRSGPAIAADPSAVDIRSEEGKVLIAADQIRSYDWATHTFTLVSKVRQELADTLRKSKRIVSGIPFGVAVGGKVVYSGTFTSLESSRSLSTPVILTDPRMLDPKMGEDQLRIQLGYPTAAFFKGDDPRSDKRIHEALKATGKIAKTDSEHAEWLAKAMREMATIKPGMTRADLLRVFEEEGGLSTRTQRRYVYRGSKYIKVDVTFEPVGEVDDKAGESRKDKVTTISRPFLDWEILD
jgi:hypothetical protein